jgi:glycosyltransferase involved in cell wall biosynthesis
MRIAVVVAGGLHPSGRTQVVPILLTLLSRLAKHHEVHAFVLRHLYEPTTYDLLGFTVHDLGRPSAPLGLRRWAQERGLRFAMARWGPFDIVHGFRGDPAGLLAARAGRRLRIPSVVTCDSGEFVSIPEIDYGSQRTPRGRSTIAEACRLASRVHVSSNFQARLASQHGVDAVMIPLGIQGALGALGALGAKGALGARGAPFRLLQVASLSRVKNQRLAIDAVAILSRRMPVRLDLVGEDTLGGELQAHARAAGVGDRVGFHGFVPNDELAAFHQGADAYVQTSRHDAAPVAVLEAAGFGLPVIGTRVGYVADWAPDRATAIDDPTPDAFASALEAFAADAARRQAQAAAAAAWIAEHDADWSAAQIEELYRAARDTATRTG